MQLLPLGSIVRLEAEGQKLMIVGRVPLTEEKGEIGYYDYSACLYPHGQTNQNFYFFNNEDIAEVLHEGFADEEEKAFQELFEKTMKDISYPHFQVAR